MTQSLPFQVDSKNRFQYYDVHILGGIVMSIPQDISLDKCYPIELSEIKMSISVLSDTKITSHV